MYDVVTFGEAMLRLSPPHFARLEQTHSLDVEIGGSELNVAVGAGAAGHAVRLGLQAAEQRPRANGPQSGPGTGRGRFPGDLQRPGDARGSILWNTGPRPGPARSFTTAAIPRSA